MCVRAPAGVQGKGFLMEERLIFSLNFKSLPQVSSVKRHKTELQVLFNFKCIYIRNLYEILLFVTVASELHAFVNAI